MKYHISWSKSAENALNEIIDYMIENNDLINDQNIFSKIKGRAELLQSNSQQGRIVPEMKSFGDKYREIIVKPWRIIYTTENRLVNILLIIDGRRDLEEDLYEIIVKIDHAKSNFKPFYVEK